MTNLDIDELKRLHGYANDGTWIPSREKTNFSDAIFSQFPALLARIAEPDKLDTYRAAMRQIMSDMEGGTISVSTSDAELLKYAATGFPASLRAIIERRDGEGQNQ